LVSGNHFNAVQVQTGLPGSVPTFSIGGDPAIIGDGRLRGLQNAIGTISTQIQSLDDLAASITARVNTLHTSGTDAYGNAGTDFLSPYRRLDQ